MTSFSCKMILFSFRNILHVFLEQLMIMQICIALSTKLYLIYTIFIVINLEDKQYQFNSFYYSFSGLTERAQLRSRSFVNVSALFSKLMSVNVSVSV